MAPPTLSPDTPDLVPRHPLVPPCTVFLHPALRQVGGEVPVVLGLGTQHSKLAASPEIAGFSSRAWRCHSLVRPRSLPATKGQQRGQGTAQTPSKGQDNGIQRRADGPPVSIKLLPAPAFRFVLGGAKRVDPIPRAGTGDCRGVLDPATEPDAVKQKGTHAPGQLPPDPIPMSHLRHGDSAGFVPTGPCPWLPRFGAMTPMQFISSVH